MAAACSVASKSDSRENFAFASGLRREDVVSITNQATVAASSSSARAMAPRQSSRELRGGALDGGAIGAGVLGGTVLSGGVFGGAVPGGAVLGGGVFGGAVPGG